MSKTQCKLVVIWGNRLIFFDIWSIFDHFFIEILCLGLHFSIQVCLHFNWCVTAGKIENIHLPMQVPFCKIQKTIQGPKELNEKIDNLHWQCKSPSGTRIVPIKRPNRIILLLHSAKFDYQINTNLMENLWKFCPVWN